MIGFDLIWDEAPVLAGVAKGLKEKGHDVLAVMIGNRWKLEANGLKQENLSNFYEKEITQDEIKTELDRIDKLYGGPMMFFVINDRLLRRDRYRNWEKYFVQTVQFWEYLFNQYLLTHFFCTGMAFMPLLVGNVIARQRGIYFLAIHHTRDTELRVYFSYDYSNTPLFLNDTYENLLDLNNESVNSLQEYIQSKDDINQLSRGIPIRSDSLGKRWQHKNLSYRFIREFTTRLRRNCFQGWGTRHDFVTPSILDLLQRHFFSFIKRLILSMVPLFEQPESDESFIFFPLHVQPEASSEIFSPWFSDQISLIKNIALAMPINVKLYVKEHKPMLGRREGLLRYYKKIKSIPNVKLISPYASSRQFIERSISNIVITGTVGWESLLYGKKPLVFGNVHYNISRLTVRVHSFDALYKTVKNNIRNQYLTDLEKEMLLRFMTAMKLSSYKGIFNPPHASPEALDPNNIADLGKAIEDVLKRTLKSHKDIK
jgi:hypothetical protein